jgi:PAS domain S-box-containing protein
MNKPIHSLLKRQIKRNFGEKYDFSDNRINQFLDSVNEAYYEFDEDRRMLERSLDLSSKELLQTNSELRTLLQALPDLIFIVDGTGRILDVKGGKETDLQMPRESYIGKYIFRTWDKSINLKFRNAINKTLETGKSQLIEYELKLQSDRKYYEVKILLLLKSQLLVVIEDISRRKQDEEFVRESFQRFKSIVDNSSDIITEASFDGKFTYVSPKIEQILGYKPEELIGKSIFEHIHPDDISEAIKQFSQAVHGLGTSTLMHRYKNKKGDWKILETSGTAFKTRNGDLKAVMSSHDITDKKKMEEEIIKSQKLESLAVLAGGIAHDFNNILSIILGNLSLSQTYVERKKYSQINDILLQACNAAYKASDLINQLTTFARGGYLRKRTISISNMLKESIEFALRGSNVKCQHSFPMNLKLVDVDESQINQVINNLVINAKEAMPNGGMIKVSAENVNLDKTNGLNLNDGEYIKLVFEDTGVGIPHEIIDKIFDPFFTTKNSGSGLGLATSHSIIAKHGGKMIVNSEVGQGTKFEIFIPCSDKDSVEHRDVPKLNSYFSGNILVMDDEQEMRTVIEGMLVALGFTVDTAENGEEAINKYKNAMESGSPYNMVLLDLVIPGEAGGVTTLSEIEKIDPGVKGIITSGYAGNLKLDDYENRAFKAYLKKPFSISDLTKTILDVMK